jgi:hypothetical protein
MPKELSGRPAARVRALFETDALSFRLPPGATFADLADRIAHAAARTNSKAIAVAVTLGTAPTGG